MTAIDPEEHGCRYPRCGEWVRWPDLYCAAHRAILNRADNSAYADRGTRADKRYKTAKWRNTRRAVLARDLECQVCHHAPATEVDHIKPPRDGGLFYSMANLQGLCAHDHGVKTAAETRARPATPPPARRQSTWNR